MNELQNHEMIFEKKHPSGADEWFCPACGRRMLLAWEPKFTRTVLEDGDPHVTHGGFKNAMEVGEPATLSGEITSSYESHENVELNIDETRLAPWKAWMDKRDFDDLWPNSPQ